MRLAKLTEVYEEIWLLSRYENEIINIFKCMKHKNKILLFCIISLSFIGCDRATKSLAKEHLQNKEPLSYFHDTLRFEYAENTGAFLSFGSDWPQAAGFIVFTILPLLFLSGLFIYAIKKSGEMSFLKQLAFVLIFSGGIGNLIDRIIFNKHVSDFLNVGINNFRSGIFNLADMYITTGVLILLFLSFTEREKLPSV
jgi:signal peptidase II